MAVSTNLKYHGNKNLLKLVRQAMATNRYDRGSRKKMCYKNNGAPGATDTPTGLGDICLRTDVTPNTVFVNTTYDVAGAANVWTQIA